MDAFEKECYEKYNKLVKELNALKQNIFDYEIEVCNKSLQKILGIKLDLKPYLDSEGFVPSTFCHLQDLFREIKKDPELSYYYSSNMLPGYIRKEKNFIKYMHQRILEAMKESLGIDRFGRGYFYLYKHNIESENTELKNNSTALLKALKSSSKVKTEIDKHLYKFTLKPSKDTKNEKQKNYGKS